MKKGDYIIIVFLLLLTAVSFLFLPYKSGEISTQAVIRLNGKIKETVKLTDNYKKTIEIRNKLGYNIIKIDGKRICVTDADCPGKDDVRAGYISKPGQAIICLPHRLVITIEGEKDIDYVSY